MELWDVYDKYRHCTGRTHEREIPMKSEDYHIVVHIWIINDKGEILIQRRQPWKKGWPNMWDCSAAGSAIVGDTSRMAAIREVKEELGFDLNIDNGEKLLTIKFSRGFDDIWVVRQNVDMTDMKLQYEEVAEVKWSSEAEIKEMIQRGEFINYHFLNTFFEIVNSNIALKRANKSDAEELINIQKEVFTPILNKYQDFELSPVMQTMEKFLKRFEIGDYYKVLYNNELAGSVFVYEKEPGVMKFHIINILDKFQNKGIGQIVMGRLELLYPQAETWELETILTEERNCYLYEKMGYVRTGVQKVINDKMTIIEYKKVMDLKSWE